MPYLVTAFHKKAITILSISGKDSWALRLLTETMTPARIDVVVLVVMISFMILGTVSVVHVIMDTGPVEQDEQELSSAP